MTQTHNTIVLFQRAVLLFSFNRQCAITENIHWILLGGGSVRPKKLKKCMKLNWGVHHFRGGGGVDIFWNYMYTMLINRHAAGHISPLQALTEDDPLHIILDELGLPGKQLSYSMNATICLSLTNRWDHSKGMLCHCVCWSSCVCWSGRACRYDM